MPASGCDPVVGALRFAFSPAIKRQSNCDFTPKTSAKRALLTRIDHEPLSTMQKTLQTSHKSKYTIMNPQNLVNNNRTNGISNKTPGAQLPAPKTTLYPIDKVQLGFRGALSVGSGMMNLGNTCYLNSTLQALFHVPAFVNWLLSDNTHLKCEQTSAYQMHPDDITCAVIKTFKCSQQNAGSHMRPMCVYSKLRGGFCLIVLSIFYWFYSFSCVQTAITRLPRRRARVYEVSPGAFGRRLSCQSPRPEA